GGEAAASRPKLARRRRARKQRAWRARRLARGSRAVRVHATNVHAANRRSRTPATAPIRDARGSSLSITSNSVRAAIQETLITPVANGTSMSSPQQAIEDTLARKPPASPPLSESIRDAARQRARHAWRSGESCVSPAAASSAAANQRLLAAIVASRRP